MEYTIGDRGYYFDNETGLYYLNSRYYDPQVGRFINADSINYIDAKNFSGLNLYAYCYNNPVIFLDDRGCFPRWAGWLIIGLVAMAFTAVAAFAITSAVISISTMGTAAIGTSVVSGMGVSAVTAMAISIDKQGGFAKADLLKVAGAMFLGAVTGAIAGAFGHVATGSGQAIGSSIGSNIAKVRGRSIVSSTTSMLLTTTSSAIVGAVAGTASNILLNRAFDGLDGEHETLGETITGTVQSDVFSWLYALLNWLFE